MINERIKAPEVRVIDASGTMLGVMATTEALALARSQGLDLIEVPSKSQPPVAKILSFDKYRYQLDKATQKQRKKQKKIELKGIRLSVRIGTHDMAFKVSQAEKFMSRGNKVRVELLLRGRERANLEYAFGVVKKFLAAISLPFLVEQEPKRLGGLITTIIAPKV